MIPEAIPWRLIGIVSGTAVIAAVLWWAQGRIRVSYQAEAELEAKTAQFDAYRETVQAVAERAAAKMERDQLADAEHTSRLSALQAEQEALREAAARIPTTVERTDANGVRRLAVNPDRWLCVSTFVSRDAADAAACKARAGASVLPDAISR